MVSKVFVSPKAIERMHDGPLRPYMDGFTALLLAEGCRHEVVRIQVRQAAHLSRWLQKRRLVVGALNETRLQEFRRYRRQRGFRVVVRIRGLLMLLGQLRRSGVVAPPVLERFVAARMRIEGAYTQYLVRERRLSRTTVHNYLWVVREFLSERYRSRQICLAELNSDAVTSFVLRYAANGSTAGTAQFVATGLRSFLRFLQIRGKIKRDLAACVPKVPSWRDTNVPVSLTAAEVRRVIGHCDRHTSAGQRDGAILMLLARLGLRAAEVGGLLLDDIHWAEGEITIRGKGGRRHRFPLPQDVGEALTLYLRSSRPRCQSRWVFVRLRAPFRPFAHPSAAIGSIVARALERGDLHPPQRGAHLLRHTAATRMLRRGASLAEIGEVLRHRSPMTTTIYAKVDLKALRSVAAPWPQVR